MVSGVNTLKRDLQHYVKHFKSHVDENLCDTLVNEIKMIEFKEHTFYDPQTGQAKPRSCLLYTSPSPRDDT